MAADTSIVDILQAIEDRLLAILPVRSVTYYEDLDASQIIWAIDDAPPHIKGDFDIVLHPGREANMISIDDGGGRSALRCSQTIDVILRTQSALSQFGNDKEKITKHFRLQRPILDALAGIMLLDTDDNELLTRPILWLSTQQLVKGRSPQPARNLWGHTAMTFEVHFKPLLDSQVLT